MSDTRTMPLIRFSCATLLGALLGLIIIVGNSLF